MNAGTHRWFQFHLSTVIALCFVMGGLLWANVLPLETSTTKRDSVYYYYGWPFHWGAVYSDPYDRNEPEFFLYRVTIDGSYARVYNGQFPIPAIPYLLAELLVWLGIVACTAFAAEELSHLREKMPLRPLWPFHLTTTVVLILSVSAIIWANSQQYFVFETSTNSHIRVLAHGWPASFQGDVIQDLSSGDGGLDDKWSKLNATALSANVSVGLWILAVLATACEWLIRRREACKP